MSAEFRVISIGTLAAHPLWDERADARTGHATSTLITSEDVRLLVDPGLPPAAMIARLGERTNVRPDEITHVFLTSFTVDHYRSLPAFGRATWLIHAPEREAAATAFEQQLEWAQENSDHDAAKMVRDHLDLIGRCQDAPDSIARGVDLFPVPGVTPGTCGLLLPTPRASVLLCGDAVATTEHLEQGKVLPSCVDLDQAQESFREALEIADLLVPGRDNVTMNPVRGPF